MGVFVSVTDRANGAGYVPDGSGCWLWYGALGSKGYGQLTVSGKSVKAHRFVYERNKGTIPAGLTLDHLCRNRACVNPDHLEPVTLGENTMRGMCPQALNARKTHCLRGHPLEPIPSKPGYRHCRTCSAADKRRYALANNDRRNAMARVRWHANRELREARLHARSVDKGPNDVHRG